MKTFNAVFATINAIAAAYNTYAYATTGSAVNLALAVFNGLVAILCIVTAAAA